MHRLQKTDDPNLDARPLFQAALQYVGKHHTILITLDHGSYYFLTPQNSQSFYNKVGTHIELQEATMTEVQVPMVSCVSPLPSRIQDTDGLFARAL